MTSQLSHPEVTPPPKLSPTTRGRCWWLTPPTNEELAKDEEEARESDMCTEEAEMDKASSSRARLSPPPEGVTEPLLPQGPTTDIPTPHDLHLAHQHVWPPAQMPVFTDEVYNDMNGDYVCAEEVATAVELSEVRRRQCCTRYLLSCSHVVCQRVMLTLTGPHRLATHDTPKHHRLSRAAQLGRRRAVAWAWFLVIVLFSLAAALILLLVLFGAFTSLSLCPL
jgi:hypothetical protein